MTAHKENRIQWNKVLKIIRSEEDRDTISLRDIAKKLEVESEPLDDELKIAIKQLVVQNRIRVMIGRDRKNMTCL